MPLSGLRIMLVEDDQDSRELLLLVLEAANAEVLALANAREALKAISQFVPDVLLVDLFMPEMNGLDLIRELRQCGLTAPAVAVTAAARLQDVQAAQNAGFDRHIAKPVDLDALIDLVLQLVSEHRKA